MIRKLLLQILARGLVAAALLFGVAGTIFWPAAWIFLAEMGFLSLALGLWLARHDPLLLAERLAPFVQTDQKAWDRRLTTIMTVVSGFWFAIMALDAGRWRHSEMPLWGHLSGAMLIAVFISIVRAVMKANTFAVPVVKVQAAGVHKVAWRGPYAIVRHPMYAATLLFFVGAPLLLGSWWGLACFPVLAALLVTRTLKEDRTLLEELPGYAEYALRTRWRLVPFVW